jgi:NADPH:quinone reductase-like Zn-dependent oxidoreductase
LGHVILKSKYLGIKASDINYTAGRYLPGVKLPFACDFECVGTVVAANGTKHLKEGNHAFSLVRLYVFAHYGSLKLFDSNKCLQNMELLPKYVIAPENMCVKIPNPSTAMPQ